MIYKCLHKGFVFFLLLSGCILLMGASSKDLKSQSSKSSGRTASPVTQVSDPLLAVQKVYIHPKTGNLHVVIRNKKKVKVSPSTYTKARLYMRPKNALKPWSWSLSKLDPKRSSFKKDVDFDTEKTLSESTPVRVWLKDVPSQGEWKKTLGPRPGHAGRKKKRDMASKTADPKPLNIPSTLEDRDRSGDFRRAQDRASSRFSHEQPDPIPSPRITSISPQPATVGGRLTIRGDNFSWTQRHVYVKLEGGWRTDNVITSDGPIHREVYVALHGVSREECTVNSWGNKRITVTIPDSLGSIVGETVKIGRLFLELPEFDHEIRIGPDPDSLIPVITRLSSQTIRPGQSLVIEGRRFLEERPGTVKFQLSGRMIDGRLDDWNETYIIVIFPSNVEGLPEVAGVVKVRNHAGLETVRSITFRP